MYCWTVKNEVNDYYSFGNITECLKTKVCVRIEWLEDLVLGVREGEKEGG